MKKLIAIVLICVFCSVGCAVTAQAPASDAGAADESAVAEEVVEEPAAAEPAAEEPAAAEPAAAEPVAEEPAAEEPTEEPTEPPRPTPAVPFDNSVLENLDGYEYDKFAKSWSYYQAYVEEYSDAYVVIGLQVDSEEGSTNIDGSRLYAKILDKDGETLQLVESIAFMIGDTIYAFEGMYPGDSASFVFLNEKGYPLIKALAAATAVSVKIVGDGGSNIIDLDPALFASTLKTFCQTAVKYDMWDYIIYDEIKAYAEGGLYALRIS